MQSIPSPGCRNSRPRILFYCQHSMGLGHLVRSTEIVRGLEKFDVTFVNAGELIDGFEPPQNAKSVLLPPLRVDQQFRYIKADTETESFETIRETRRELLRALWQRIQPEILMIELFPFGRSKFEFELIPLLREIRLRNAPTKVVCSLRDILVSRNKQVQWERRVCWLVNRYFDLILVHSDPNFQRLEESFGRVFDLHSEIRYTGFVVQTPGRLGDETLRIPRNGKPLIVASIGGGRIGGELLDCAIQASALIQNSVPHHMVVVTGPHVSDADWARVQALAGDNPDNTVIRYTGRFLDYLAKADLSISLAGYNTCMNLLTSRVPALVYPVTGYNKDEQVIRAQKLEALGVVSVIRHEDLTPEALGRKIQASLRRTAQVAPRLDTQGVANTARLLSELIPADGGIVQTGYRP